MARRWERKLETDLELLLVHSVRRATSLEPEELAVRLVEEGRLEEGPIGFAMNAIYRNAVRQAVEVNCEHESHQIGWDHILFLWKTGTELQVDHYHEVWERGGPQSLPEIVGKWEAPEFLPTADLEKILDEDSSSFTKLDALVAYIEASVLK